MPSNTQLDQTQKFMHQNLQIDELLKLGRLRSEKCDLREAGQVFEFALEKAKASGNYRGMGEALAHLLRLASDMGDDASLDRWRSELDVVVAQSGDAQVPYSWYCKGVITFRRNQLNQAQVLFHRFLREVRNSEPEDSAARIKGECQALQALATVAITDGKLKRAEFLSAIVRKHAEATKPHGVLSSNELLNASLAERRGDFAKTREHLNLAFSECLREHNWLHYLSVILGMARLARLQKDFSQSRFLLSIVEAAAQTGEIRSMQASVAEEKTKLNLNQVDLEIDMNRRVIKTRENEVALGRQHILLEIVHELSKAHDAQGLTKAEIIEKVWGEDYSPDAHDGKLYYNINRIRKLIEPNQKTPSYLLNSRNGYRLAPELRIRVLDRSSTM